MARRKRAEAPAPTSPEPSSLDRNAILGLLLLLLHVEETWWVRLPLSALVISGLLFPRLRLQATLWMVAALAVLTGDVANWHTADNHKFLIGYWCLAVACALRAEQREEALAFAGRWMIALAFGLAVVWKLTSGDYLDGSFFTYQLLVDWRFANFAELFGGVTPAVREANEAARKALLAWDATGATAPFQAPASLRPLTLFLTWWTLAIELVLALWFALAPRLRWASGRHLLLLVFIFAVYTIAPVIGFGSVLTVMGYAQCRREERRWRIAYLVTFIVLQAYGASWNALNDAFSAALRGA